ncbi:hypothetical protein GCM10010174_80950 [Kutzneria viridogrisea]|uniref:Uncharacterized protein n=1 Tax=Kutzneria viridogrisea TaxID=47990 RepID=A0ABR6C021_9PSEU|nr:hypothetical protein [Kutzneria viridogrisea]
MRGSQQHSDEWEFKALVEAEFSAPAEDDELDVALLDSLWIENCFGEAALDLLAEDYCRSVLSIEEIHAYRALAGVAPTPVLRLPIPADQLVPRTTQTTRCAA